MECFTHDQNLGTQLVAASTQYWTAPDSATLSAGAGVISTAGFAKFDSLGTNRVIWGKGVTLGVAASAEYGVIYNTTSGRIEFWASDGTTEHKAIANVFGAPPLSVWLFIAAGFDGTTQWISVNGGTRDTTAWTGSIRDGGADFRVGVTSSATAPMDGAVDNVLLYGRSLSINEVTQLYANWQGIQPSRLSGSLLTSLAGAWDLGSGGTDLSGSGNTLSGVNSPSFASAVRSPRGGRVFFDGNSLTASMTYPAHTQDSLGALWTNSNVANSGQTTAEMITRAPAFIDAYRVDRARQVVVAWEIGNDIVLGATAQDSYDRFAAYCLARKQLGFKVIALTVLPRSYTAPQETARLAANTLLRSNWTTFADRLVDLTLDPDMGPPGSNSNATYYTDGTHLTDTGSIRVASYVAPAVLSFA